MHPPSLRLLLGIGAVAAPILFACPLARCQVNTIPGNRGRQVQIDVTIRDSSGEIVSEQAHVELFLNGTPCDQRSTSNGRVTFSISDLGRFTAVVTAPGYQPGQGELSVSEPVKVEMEVDLEREHAGIAAVGAEAILAPKAREALDKGMQALREEKLEAAEKALDQAAKLAPNNPQVLYEQGVLALKKLDWAKAQSALERVTQMQPNSAGALAALGMALCNQKKYAAAIPPLEKSLALEPAAGWQTHWSLAESYYHNQRFAEALKVSEQAEAKSNGEVPAVDLLVARSLTAVGRYEDSAKVLRELVKNHGDGPEGATARRFLERLAADGKIQQQPNP